MPNRIELTDGEWQTFYSLLLLNQLVYVGSAGILPVLSQCRFGYYAVAHSGGYYLLHWANGTQCLNAFQDGARVVYGKAYLRAIANILIYNRC